MLASSSLIADIESIATDQILNNHNLHLLYSNSRFLFWSRKSSIRETLQTESQKQTFRSLKCTKTTYETRSDTLIGAFQKKKKLLVSTAIRKRFSSTTKSCIVSSVESKLLRNCSDLVWNRIAVAGIEAVDWDGNGRRRVWRMDLRIRDRIRPRNWNLGFCDRVFHGERDFRVPTLTRGGSGAGLVMHRLWPGGPVLARA